MFSSVLSSAQQAQRLTFTSTSSPFMNDTSENHLQDPEYLQDMRDIYAETDPDVNGLDRSRRRSDLYSPELNLEAHRTAQEVLINIIYHLCLICIICNYINVLIIFCIIVQLQKC